uniref:ATP-binding protein n=1 Tax=Brevibacillus massiliensis TaxID=1118054 RepID=UPI00315DB84C
MKESLSRCAWKIPAFISKQNIWKKSGNVFYRGEPSRKRSTGGTGLGLAIAKKILDLHQAAYGVSNTEAGVLFFFSLPKKV